MSVRLEDAKDPDRGFAPIPRAKQTTLRSVTPRLPINTVLRGDCQDVLPKLATKSVDLIFADPPYNLQHRSGVWRPNPTQQDTVTDDSTKLEGFEDYDRFTRAWLTECRRVLKDTGTLWVIGSYHNIYRVGAIIQDLGYWILNDVTWVKSNPLPNFRGTRFCNAHETLLWVKKSEKQAKYTFNYQSMKAGNDDPQVRSDWHLPLCSVDERLKLNGVKAHATQKPEVLLHRILLACTNPGDIVLDPFFGTGTTGAVAKRIGRRWVGIEREETYAALAEERIRVATPHSSPGDLVPPSLDMPKTRIPFASLLEHGLIEAGDLLHLDNTEYIAVVLEDGTITCSGYRGSIHKVGSLCLKKPSCNGWDHWYFQDKFSGEYLTLEHQRIKIRNAMSDGGTQTNARSITPGTAHAAPQPERPLEVNEPMAISRDPGIDDVGATRIVELCDTVFDLLNRDQLTHVAELLQRALERSKGGSVLERDDSSLPDRELHSTVFAGHLGGVVEPRDYPKKLIDEYDLLIDKKLNRTLSKGDADRLTYLRSEINRIDRTRPGRDKWEIMEEQIRIEIAKLRVDVDAVLDARGACTI